MRKKKFNSAVGLTKGERETWEKAAECELADARSEKNCKNNHTARIESLASNLFVFIAGGKY